MFSYRHGFHAGNHADVLKHIVLLQSLDYLLNKDSALTIIDTHAGSGIYQLDSAFAQKSMEAQQGVAMLWRDGLQLPQAVSRYVQTIRRYNTDGQLLTYPGSPLLIWELLRPQDRLHLFELHPTDQRLLQSNIRQIDHKQRIKVHVDDGFAGLKPLLPPVSRRGLVLMDPSYEMKTDYQRVYQAIADALGRFANGVYLVWYPIVALPQAHQLPDKLRRLANSHERAWLNVTLKVRNPSQDFKGLVASGMFVINPPYALQTELKDIMASLVKHLGQDRGAAYTLEVQAQ